MDLKTFASAITQIAEEKGIKKEKVIEIQRKWNKQIEHAWLNGVYIWDFQLKNVIRDYEKEGYKIIFDETNSLIKTL